MVSEIAVSYKDEVYVILVDDDDYPLLSRHNWHLLPSNTKRMYAYCPIHMGNGERKMMPMTHMIMGATWCVDHKDNNPLNNQKENLRTATRQQNNWNTAKVMVRGGKKVSSKYKGVHKTKDGRWKAQIKHNGTLHQLGRFKNEVDAALAYNEAAKKYHGEWAWLNKIDQPGVERSE